MASKMSQPIIRVIAEGSTYFYPDLAPYNISVENTKHTLIWLFRFKEQRDNVLSSNAILNSYTHEQVLAKLADVHLCFMHRKGVNNE